MVKRALGMSEGIYITATNKEAGALNLPELSLDKCGDESNEIIVEKDGILYRTSASVLKSGTARITFLDGSKRLTTYQGAVNPNGGKAIIYTIDDIPDTATAALISTGMEGGGYPTSSLSFWAHGEWSNPDYEHFILQYASRVAMWYGTSTWVPVHQGKLQIDWAPTTGPHKGHQASKRYLMIHAYA